MRWKMRGRMVVLAAYIKSVLNLERGGIYHHPTNVYNRNHLGSVYKYNTISHVSFATCYRTIRYQFVGWK